VVFYTCETSVATQIRCKQKYAQQSSYHLRWHSGASETTLVRIMKLATPSTRRLPPQSSLHRPAAVCGELYARLNAARHVLHELVRQA
jgi:hypothetical protein